MPASCQRMARGVDASEFQDRRSTCNHESIIAEQFFGELADPEVGSAARLVSLGCQDTLAEDASRLRRIGGAGRLADGLAGNVKLDPEKRTARVGIDGTFPAQIAGDALGEYVLARLTTTTREVREKRARDVRLESRHGSWTGRVTDCVTVAVESPWQLDHSVPITFAVAHQDHAAPLGPVQSITDQSFCVPLWAEGYGGTQAFGVTVDAGMLGVISGTVQFGVVKTETVIGRVPVSAGPVTDTASLNIPLPTLDKYEVQLKLRDGKTQTFSESGNLGKIAVRWTDGKVELKPEAKQ
jgi:hypothetical protein